MCWPGWTLLLLCRSANKQILLLSVEESGIVLRMDNIIRDEKGRMIDSGVFFCTATGNNARVIMQYDADDKWTAFVQYPDEKKGPTMSKKARQRAEAAKSN